MRRSLASLLVLSWGFFVTTKDGHQNLGDYRTESACVAAMKAAIPILDQFLTSMLQQKSGRLVKYHLTPTSHGFKIVALITVPESPDPVEYPLSAECLPSTRNTDDINS